MAFPTNTTVLDTFTGTESPITTNWTNIQGTVSKDSGTAYGALGSNATMYDVVTNFGPIGSGTGVEAFVTIATRSTLTDQLSIASITYIAEFDGYNVYVTVTSGTNETIRLYRLDNGVGSAINDAASITINDGDKFGCRFLGSSQRMYFKDGASAWTEVGTAATDAAYTGTATLFLTIFDDVFRLDDFGGGTYIAPPLTVLQSECVGSGGQMG